jgi:hypothetical protein
LLSILCSICCAGFFYPIRIGGDDRNHHNLGVRDPRTLPFHQRVNHDKGGYHQLASIGSS